MSADKKNKKIYVMSVKLVSLSLMTFFVNLVFKQMAPCDLCS